MLDGAAGGFVTNNATLTSALLTVSNGGTYAGVIENGSSNTALTVTTGETLVLSGTNTYTGDTTVSNGNLHVDGTLTAATAVSGGTLSGIGTVTGTVTVSGTGTIDPGDVGPIAGTLTVSGLLFTGGTYHADVVGNSSDQIDVTGSPLDLGTNAQFTLSASGPTMAGTQFTFIQNDMGTPFSPHFFTNVAEGDTTPVDGKTATYSYLGGSTGNNFTLTVTGPQTITDNGGNTYTLELVRPPAPGRASSTCTYRVPGSSTRGPWPA